MRNFWFRMEKAIVYALLLTVSRVTAEDIVTNVKLSSLFADVLEKYYDKQTLIPLTYTNETMNVTIDISLASVNDFNEVGGYLEISGYLQVGWTDGETPAADANVSVLIPSGKIWKPPLLLVNSMMGTAEIGDTTSKIRCNLMSWDCLWEPWIVFRGACVSDFRFYPFDRQECSFKIAARGHYKDELKLISTRPEWNFDLYEENTEWTIQETSSETYDQSDVSFVEFKIKLKRNSTFYIINILAPVALLSIVNVFVFMIPAQSGERISFSVICFLSFVVLLNIIMGFIPSSSVNLAYLCYFVFMTMILSCGMTLATICTLWIHFKAENNISKIPAVLYCIVFVFKCVCCSTKPRKPNNVVDVEPIPAERNCADDDDNDQVKVTWKDAASVMDKFFLLGFLGAEIICSIAYLLPIILNE